MYDMKPLEEEWKQYQRKKKKPLYILALISIILIIFFLLFNTKNLDLKFLNSYFNNVNSSTSNNFDDQTSLKQRSVLLNLGLKRLETITVTSNNTIQNIDKSNELLVDIPILDIKNESVISAEKIDRKKIYLNIMETSSVTAYEDVEKRFLQSHDIDDALFLAKSYYKKGNYEKSKQWAFEVNKLNQDIEESLLIFIQSKVKLGERNDALSLLKNYLKKSNSDEAKNLLYKIEKNTL